ncbi:response regulator [Gammaproteobacteria bacterium]|nr:response regulator [Gammaproteobacteria bacterium]
MPYRAIASVPSPIDMDTALENPRLLLVEDESAIADPLSFALQQERFRVSWVTTGREALAAVSDDGPWSLVVLDIGLPDQSGLDVLRELRRISSVPVIFLTARAGEFERVLGLELGADDYLTKPFSPRELIARIRAVLRRYVAGVSDASEPLPQPQIARLVLDPQRRVVLADGAALDLTAAEYRLMGALLNSPERVFSRGQLLAHISEHPDHRLERTIDSHIKSLRSKLQAAGLSTVIQTRRGFGYFLQLPQ